MLSFFYKQQMRFSQIVAKKAKIAILFFMKNSQSNNIILDFSISPIQRKEQIFRLQKYTYISPRCVVIFKVKLQAI